MDIYFEKEYGQLYQDIENGKCEVFKHTSSLGKVRHMFIKREIPLKVDNIKYFDLVTPYGYGGPLITECSEGSEKELVKEFESEFSKYCIQKNIVSEFVRFHPMIENALDFKNCYFIEHDRNTVATNVGFYSDPIASEFSKSTRKTVRRALKEGLSYRTIENPEDISSFKEIYYSTMDRNKANEYYYFDEEYFNECLKNFKSSIILVEVLLEEKVVSSGFYFAHKKTIHAHLSGTLREYLNYSPAYILKYATVKWAEQNGYDYIHYGGGASNSESDSLLQFKKRFGQNTEYEFYTGKKIWNLPIYNKLCEISKVETDESFFPAYRKN